MKVRRPDTEFRWLVFSGLAGFFGTLAVGLLLVVKLVR